MNESFHFPCLCYSGRVRMRADMGVRIQAGRQNGDMNGIREYIQSKYIHKVWDAENERYILYSFRTGKFVTLNELQMLIYENGPFKELSSGLLRELYSAGFLTDGDEYESLKERQKKRQEEDKDVHLIIAPTMACNFSCSYCIETGQLRNGRMDEDTSDAVIRFAEKLLEDADAETLSVIWFGGEPLLETGIIGKISKELISLCDRRGIFYEAAVYTNGYFLSEKNIRLLEECRVKNIRISMDGSRKSHDAMRYLKSGAGSYDRIMENLEIPTAIQYRIRCNLTKANLGEYEVLVRNLKAIREKSGNTIYVTPERMRVEKEVSGDLKELELPYEEYYEAYLKLKDLKVCAEPDTASDALRGKKHGQVCNAVRKYSFCIDEKGNIYKCNWFFGMQEHVIGTVFDATPESLRETEEGRMFLESRIAGREKCRECKMLPICLGRCIHSWGIEGKYDCNRRINRLDETVLQAYNELEKSKG